MKHLALLTALAFIGLPALTGEQGLPKKASRSNGSNIVGGQTCGGLHADVSALLAADQAFSDATASRGLEGFLSFLADDVSTLRPDRPVLTGKQALAEAWSSLLSSPTLAIRWKPLTGGISACGDMGYTIGSYEITRGDDQGQRITGTGKYLTIWRRQAESHWMVIFDSGVSDSLPKS